LALIEATFNSLIDRCTAAQEVGKDPYKLAYRT
jgi:hypothetical protein